MAEKCKAEPIIFMTDMCFGDVQLVIEFIYTGEVYIEHDQVNHFLSLAKSLELTGIVRCGIETKQKPSDSNSLKVVVVQEKPRSLEVDESRGQSSSSNRILSEKGQLSIPSAFKRMRKSSGTDWKPNWNDGRKCKYCPLKYTNYNTLKNHERYCKFNPNHVISRCSICDKEVPQGSITFHKRTQHGYVPAKKFKASSPSWTSSSKLDSWTSVLRSFSSYGWFINLVSLIVRLFGFITYLFSLFKWCLNFYRLKISQQNFNGFSFEIMTRNSSRRCERVSWPLFLRRRKSNTCET